MRKMSRYRKNPKFPPKITSKPYIWTIKNNKIMEKFKKEMVEETKVINERVNNIFNQFTQINTEDELKELLEEGINLQNQITAQEEKLRGQELTKAEEYIIRFNLTGLVDSAKIEKLMEIDFSEIKEELNL
jgi:hypothetical protein